MKKIKPSKGRWPRHQVEAVQTRERDLVIRIADWTDDRGGEPGYDVEVYIGGVYDWNESKTFTLREFKTKTSAKSAASTYAGEQAVKLL